MRLKKIIILSLGCIGGLFSFFQTLHAQDSLSTTSYLSVKTAKTGYEVFFNEKALGNTPLENIALPAGSGKLVVRQTQIKNWRIADWSKVITLTAGDTLSITPHLQRSYLIRSLPFDAEVYWNDTFLGVTPYVLLLSDSLSHTLTIRKEGYFTRDVLCGPDSPLNFQLLLQKNENFALQSEHLFKDIQNKKKGFRRNSYLLAGLSLTTGIAAILLKRKADNLYDDYILTADPASANQSFDRTRRFDTYSSLAFGTFQASFGLGFYFFLKGN